jgi:hypothetical protein
MVLYNVRLQFINVSNSASLAPLRQLRTLQKFFEIDAKKVISQKFLFGWKRLGDETSMSIRKGNTKLTFNIRINTALGILFVVRIDKP